jgi:RNA polymerase sigma factor (sigma-70 family)
MAATSTIGTWQVVGASYLKMVSTVIRGSEADLISAAAGGDEAAFDALVGPLIEPGYKLASVMLRDSEEARDAVQEACLIAWRKLLQLRTEGGLRPWFLAIVANQCRTRRRTRWWSVITLPSIPVEPEMSHNDFDSDLDLDRELRKLSAAERAALCLFFYMDLPLVEVARILKVSPHAAKSRVHRAVVKLRLSMVEVPQ